MIIDIKQQVHFGEKHFFSIQLELLFDRYKTHIEIILVYNWLDFTSFIEPFNRYIGIIEFQAFAKLLMRKIVITE